MAFPLGHQRTLSQRHLASLTSARLRVTLPGLNLWPPTFGAPMQWRRVRTGAVSGLSSRVAGHGTFCPGAPGGPATNNCMGRSQNINVTYHFHDMRGAGPQFYRSPNPPPYSTSQILYLPGHSGVSHGSSWTDSPTHRGPEEDNVLLQCRNLLRTPIFSTS